MTLPSTDFEHIQMFGPQMRENPYPVYEHLRNNDPVLWHEGLQAWVLTRYQDVAAGLHDPRLTSERVKYLQQTAGVSELKPFFDFLGDRMIFCDGPKHTRLRGLLTRSFIPHAIEAMRPRIQRIVDQLLDPVQARGQMDVVRDLAFPLPATVIAELLGVPPDDIVQLKKWSDEFVIFFSKSPASITTDQYRSALRAAQDMTEYFRAAVVRLRGQPVTTLLGTMELAEETGDRISDNELFANANLLLVAGHETTTTLLANGVLALLRHPEQLDLLRKDPQLIPHAIEECLRFVGPVQFTHRLAREDMQVGSKQIRQGQLVYLMLASANRDPAQFPAADKFDVTRSPNHHVGFGMATHFCLGAPLARLEIQIAFETLLRRFPKMSLACETVQYRDNFNLRGPERLRVTF